MVKLSDVPVAFLFRRYAMFKKQLQDSYCGPSTCADALRAGHEPRSEPRRLDVFLGPLIWFLVLVFYFFNLFLISAVGPTKVDQCGEFVRLMITVVGNTSEGRWENPVPLIKRHSFALSVSRSPLGSGSLSRFL